MTGILSTSTLVRVKEINARPAEPDQYLEIKNHPKIGTCVIIRMPDGNEYAVNEQEIGRAITNAVYY